MNPTLTAALRFLREHRRAVFAALLLVGYAGGLAHQAGLFAHDHDHDHAHCPLCVLFETAAVATAVVAVAVVEGNVPRFLTPAACPALVNAALPGDPSPRAPPLFLR